MEIIARMTAKVDRKVGATCAKAAKHLKYWMFFRRNGARDRNRTSDTRIFNPLLYQLSYPGNGAEGSARLKAIGLIGDGF